MVTTRLLSNKGEGGSRGIYHPHWVSIEHFLIPFLNLGLSGGSGVGRGAKGGSKVVEISFGGRKYVRD